MNDKPNGLRSLKIPVVILLVVGWNILMLVSIDLNGGFGKIHEPHARIVSDIACLIVAIFFTVTKRSLKFRKMVTADSRRHLYNPLQFTIIQTVTGFLAAIDITGLLWDAIFKS